MISAVIAALTKAVFAICVLFVPCAAVGAVGTPVNAGLAKGALRARALLIVVLKFGSLLIAAAISLSVSSVLGAPLISVVIAALTKAVFAICALFVPGSGVGEVGVPDRCGLSSGAFVSTKSWRVLTARGVAAFLSSVLLISLENSTPTARLTRYLSTIISLVTAVAPPGTITRHNSI